LASAVENLSAMMPWAVTPDLQRARDALSGVVANLEEDGGGSGVAELLDVVRERRALVDEAILAASGVVVDARIENEFLVPGETAEAVVEIWNGGPFSVTAARAFLMAPEGWDVRLSEGGGGLPPGALGRWRFEIAVPEGASPSSLYYLDEDRKGDVYRWPEKTELWGLPRNPPPLFAEVGIQMREEAEEGWIEYRKAAQYRGVNKATGEFREPVLVVPALSVLLSPDRVAWPSGSSGVQDFVVHLRGSSREGRGGSVRLQVPTGWECTPASRSFQLHDVGSEVSLSFRVRPSAGVGPGSYEIRAVALTERGEEFGEGVTIIDYPHIPRAAILRTARARTSVFPVEVPEGLKVGYVMGSGDSGPDAIRQMGLDVELLAPDRIRDGDYGGLDVVVLGIRAYETRPDLRAANDALLGFARDGGTVIVQYNKYEYPQGGFAPFPVEMARPHDRVTDEGATVRILEPGHPVFLEPNRIGQEDFEGWVQERGLYFLSEWDSRYTPLLAMADPGEEPKTGGLMVAEVGDGVYVYTGLAFFRQFPEGVPGAYRLFANLLSLRGNGSSGGERTENGGG
jgi:hypothetical protein